MFEWKIFLGHTTLDLLREVQELMEKEIKVQPWDFEDRLIFLSMYNDIDWTRKGNRKVCVNNSMCVADHASNFPERHWSFLGPGCE